MDLVRLDRELEAAVGAVGLWRARVRAGDEAAWGEPSPLESRRSVQGKRLRDEVAALVPPSTLLPLRDALVLQVESLTAARITAEAEVALARAEHAAVGKLHLERLELVSAYRATRGLARARSPESARRHLDALADCAPKLAAAKRHLREIEDEVLLRFGVATPYVHGLGDAALEQGLFAAARAFLRLTRDLADDELKRRPRSADERWPLALDLLMARAATEGWPTKLAPRFVLEALPEWPKGVRLPAFTVPEALGGASFARAFASFGVALRQAFVPRALPFVLRAPRRDVASARFGLLFGSLLATAPFGVRRLHLPQRLATGQARAFAVAFLLHARRLCAKLARREGAPADELADAVFAEAHPAAGSLFEGDATDAPRALALFELAPLLAELRDRHDVDWFDNPRAIHDLRSRSAAPESVAPPREGAANDLAKAFEDALR